MDVEWDVSIRNHVFIKIHALCRTIVDALRTAAHLFHTFHKPTDRRFLIDKVDT
jgi:hypothetical protein